MWKYVVVQGFGTELDHPGNIFGLGIGMQSSEEGIPACLPLVPTVEPKLI